MNDNSSSSSHTDPAGSRKRWEEILQELDWYTEDFDRPLTPSKQQLVDWFTTETRNRRDTGKLVFISTRVPPR